MIWNENPTRIQGLPDLLLPHALVDDGVLLQRDGSLLASWAYSGPDFISATEEETWAHSDRLNKALQLGSGWLIQADVIRSEVHSYLPVASFPDPASQLIDEERRQQFCAPGARYETEYFLTLTYLPPYQREEKVRGFCYDDLHGGSNDRATKTLDMFRNRIEVFENVAGSLLDLRRLKSIPIVDEFTFGRGEHDELLRFLRRCITGVDHPFRTPDVPICLNDLLGADFSPGLEPIVDGKHVRVIAIDGFPMFSRPGILAEVDRLPLEYRWHTRAIPLDGYEAQKLWGKIERGWGGVKKRGMDLFRKEQKTKGDAHAERMELEAYQAGAQAAEGRVQTANYTSVLVVMDRDRDKAEDAAKQLQKTIRNVGFGARIEDVNANEAWRGSIPGEGYKDCRRVMLHTLNLAHMLPVSSLWTGAAVNPSKFLEGAPALLMGITNGSTPVHINLHVDDVGHTLILGPSGSGKTTLMSVLGVSWLRYPHAQVFCFDRGYGIWPTTMAVGGDHYDIAGPDSDMCFAPLAHLSDSSDVTWACDWIEGLCELNGLQFTPLHRNATAAAMERLRSVKTGRTLTDFHATVQNMEIREALEHFTMTGPLGALLDSEHDAIGNSRWIAFETEHLLGLDPKAVIPVLLYLFRRIEMRLDGSPTLILLDEAWSYLEHPLFQRMVRQWLRTMRKKNAVVVMASQQISDIAASAIADVILENCPTKILLPNAEARNPGSREFYNRVGLNDPELAMLQAAIPKKHYYLVSRGNRRLIDLDCGRVLLSFCGVEGKQRAAMRDLISRYPDTWLERWLQARNLPDWAARLTAIQKEESLCASA